jgi:uncharacterized protein
MNYKLNKYLYFKNKGDIVIIMNLLNQSLFALTKEKIEILKSSEFTILKEKYPTFYSAMTKVGVIIPQEENELDQIRMKNREAVFDNKIYRLTLNPTLECNFHCWYCYEKHPKGKMSDKIIKSIIKHVENKIKTEKIEHLILDWFGGEPLLYFDNIMYPLLKNINELVNTNNILISNSITTNGFLIDSDMIKKFEETGLNNFQITLDGNKKIHDKIRFTAGKKGSFDRILENVNLLAKMDTANISLRINYTEATLIDILDIISYISEEAKSKITLMFQQVWQDSFKKGYVSADSKIKSFEDNGFRVQRHYLNTKGYVCYADRKNQAVINCDGKVFKCTARDFSNYQEDGILTDSGNIEWRLPLLSKRLGNATFENEYCLKCDLLPVCFGPCSQKMVEFKVTDDFAPFCLHGGFIHMIEQEIESFYNKLDIK